MNECVFGESSSLALVSYPSSDGVTIKIPYGVDVLHRPGLHPIYSYCVDAYHFLPLTDLNRCFLVALCLLIARRRNLEVAIKRLLHQVKIPG